MGEDDPDDLYFNPTAGPGQPNGDMDDHWGEFDEEAEDELHGNFSRSASPYKLIVALYGPPASGKSMWIDKHFPNAPTIGSVSSKAYMTRAFEREDTVVVMGVFNEGFGYPLNTPLSLAKMATQYNTKLVMEIRTEKTGGYDPETMYGDEQETFGPLTEVIKFNHNVCAECGDEIGPTEQLCLYCSRKSARRAGAPSGMHH